MKTRKEFGFTLIELMITVAIIGILAAIAIPSYQRYVSKSNRVDAKNALLKIAAEQEKYYLENNTYFGGAGATFATVNTANNWFKTSSGSVISNNGNYTLTVTQNGANTFAQSYVAKAIVIGTSVQARDKDCKELSIDGSGTRDALDAANVATEQCW